jgi:hypothetical protein
MYTVEIGNQSAGLCRYGKKRRIQAHQQANAPGRIVFGASFAPTGPGIIGHTCLYRHSGGRHSKHSRCERNPEPEKQCKETFWR